MNIRRRHPSPAVGVQELRFQVKTPDAAPQHILEEIVWQKEVEVEQMREKTPLVKLRQQLATTPPTLDFVGALRQATRQPALIAEVKKASPSKGVIRPDFDPVVIAKAYESAGATCLSVLTDEKFFQGSFDYLRAIRAEVKLPLLCKEFIIHPYQMCLARVCGADAVLLIAAVLDNKDLQYFIKIAATLGLATLIEVHTLEELDRVLALEGVSLIGINNRNLEDFTVDLQTTTTLLAARREILQQRQILVVSESGLYHAQDLIQVQTAGAAAVLIGESLVKKPAADAGADESTRMQRAIAALYER
jgi:indole-3-glycerol phosphate synthase